MARSTRWMVQVLQGALLAAAGAGGTLATACGGNGGTTAGADGAAPEPDGGSVTPDGGASADGGSRPNDASAQACTTDAAGFCGCGSTASPSLYSLPLTGDPASCGLGPDPAKNLGTLCQGLCGSCFGYATGSTCWLSDAGTSVECSSICGAVGRKPPGLLAARSEGAGLGKHFAQASHLEAASVDAFLILGDELRAHGAPSSLAAAAARAAGDEVRHARATARLARTYGATPPAARVRRRQARSLEAVAIDNAVEGCVRETFGALVAMWQARAARDARVRDVMARIAPEEARHAALSWRIAAWSRDRLPPAARARVDRAMRQAVRTLAREIRLAPSEDLVARAGLPTAEHASRLLRQLEGALWSPAPRQAGST